MNPNEPNQQQFKGAGPPRRMCNVAAMSFQLSTSSARKYATRWRKTNSSKLCKFNWKIS